MDNAVYQMEYAGHPLRYRFLYPETRSMFRPLPQPAEGEADIAVSYELHQRGRNLLPPDSSDAYVEYRCLIEPTARTMLQYNCSLFHGVAFFWRDLAWILTAPPGTGKTTQYRNWIRQHRGEIRVISGDKPMLEKRDDGSVWVHPSPWNGKENFAGRDRAPLGGIVLLEQGKCNSIRPLTAREAVLPLFRQFLACPVTEGEILAQSGLLDAMLRFAPSWKFINLGDAASTELMRETLLARKEKEEV